MSQDIGFSNSASTASTFFDLLACTAARQSVSRNSKHTFYDYKSYSKGVSFTNENLLYKLQNNTEDYKSSVING